MTLYGDYLNRSEGHQCQSNLEIDPKAPVSTIFSLSYPTVWTYSYASIFVFEGCFDIKG